MFKTSTAALSPNNAISKRQLPELAREHAFAFSVANSLPVGIVVADLTGRIQYINQAYTEQFGYVLADLKNRHIAEFAVPLDQKRFEYVLKQRLYGESSVYRYQMFRKDGSIADVEMNGKPYLDQHQQPIGKVAVARDITQELALEKATFAVRQAQTKQTHDTLLETRRMLEEERNFAFELMESLQEGFALLDLEAKFVYTNLAFASLCGMSPLALVGLSAKVFVHPDDLDATVGLIAQVRPDSAVKFELRIRQADFKIRYVRARVSFRVNKKREVLGYLLAARDISTEIESSQKLHQLESELRDTQAKVQRGLGFFGRLETIGGAANLIQMLSTSALDGAIQLDDSMIFLRQARFVAVHHPKLTGQAALEALIQRQRGRFQFLPGIFPEQQQFNFDPIQMILEFVSKQDEFFAPTPTPHESQVVLPDSRAARAFMQGLGGREHFIISVEDNKVVLFGRGIRVVVLEAQIEDFSFNG